MSQDADAQHDAALIREIVEQTGEVAYRYRLWPTPGYEFITPSVVRLLGYTPEEFYADPQLPAKLIHPDDAHLMHQVVEAPDGQEVAVDLRWFRRDGSLVRTDVRCVVTRGESGQPVQVDGVARDVTWSAAADEQRLRLVGERGREQQPQDAAGRVRVVIADDHDLTRAGLRAVLTFDPGLELVGEATDGRQVVELARQLQPDLVLMDVRMPGVDGLEATRRLKQVSPLTCVLILSMYEDVDLLREAMKAGAAGYVLKASNATELRVAMWEAVRGEWPVDRHLARDVLRRLADEQPSRPPTAPPPNDALSPREREVLRLIANGRTNREIAERLVVTPHTVKIHVEHILTKLGVSDRTQAAVRAIELGYVTPDDAH